MLFFFHAFSHRASGYHKTAIMIMEKQHGKIQKQNNKRLEKCIKINQALKVVCCLLLYLQLLLLLLLLLQ